MLNRAICKSCIDRRRKTDNDTSFPNNPKPWSKWDDEEWDVRAMVFCMCPTYWTDVREEPPFWCECRAEQLMSPGTDEVNPDEMYSKIRLNPRHHETRMVPPLQKLFGQSRFSKGVARWTSNFKPPTILWQGR